MVQSNVNMSKLKVHLEGFLVVYFQIVHIIKTVLNYYYSLTQFILYSQKRVDLMNKSTR